MKLLYIVLLSMFVSPSLFARVLEVRSGGTYTSLGAAAAAAQPGDTILFRAGIYPGGESISGLQGTAEAPIVVMAAPGEEVLLRGGSNAWHLTDPAHLIISGFTLEGQTGNGINMDDGGTFDTPAHHIVIDRCIWNGIDATGNNDLLKMSGVDSFVVQNCTFRNGAAGGSMVDMVGCHWGLFIGNRFEQGGSNAIQAKGASRYIRIERNRFINGGQRAINIGGSTGLQFFRPPSANFEASDIAVYSNFFVGSMAPLAFVGAVNSEAVNNTIYLPDRWAIRILQETTESNFLQCGDNAVRNNIFVVGSAAASPTINVGPNTRPTTFLFENNLWFNRDSPNWNGPIFPAPETNGIIGSNPMLTNPPTEFTVANGSPVIGRGVAVNEPMFDYFGRAFATPRSIGAVEGNTSTTSVEGSTAGALALALLQERSGADLLALVTMPQAGTAEIELYDLLGNRVWSTRDALAAGESIVHIPLAGYPAGRYFCAVRSGGAKVVRGTVVAR